MIFHTVVYFLRFEDEVSLRFEDDKAQFCPTLCNPMDCMAPLSWDFPGKNTGVGCHFLLQGIFLTQGLNLGLLRCKQTPYQLLPLPGKSFLRFSFFN